MVYKSAEVQRFFGIQHARVADACSSSTMEQLGLALLESHTLDKDWENSDEESSDGSDCEFGFSDAGMDPLDLATDDS